MKYTCPYCNKPTTATSPHVFRQEIKINLGEDSDLGEVFVVIHATSCPDPDCKKLSLKTYLTNKKWDQNAHIWVNDVINFWQLLPESNAKVLPEYLPQAIKEDYYEACRIRDLSPKASATLSRRCLQGMIRDFHGISKSRLIDEIEELEGKIENDVWESIDAVRKVGNISAHMEKDINVMIDVEPEEAQLLISLIEQLVDEWYVARDDRKKRTEKLKTLAAEKQAAK